MKMQQLAPSIGAVTKRKRLGRGIGSGLGKTCGKGHKGQNARSGGGVKLGFEGGQIPLHRRIPKIGFKNSFKKAFAYVNIGDLELFENGTVVTEDLLYKNGLIGRKEEYGLKILGGGTLTKKLTVKANKFSQTAQDAIQKCGGKIEVI